MDAEQERSLGLQGKPRSKISRPSSLTPHASDTAAGRPAPATWPIGEAAGLRLERRRPRLGRRHRLDPVGLLVGSRLVRGRQQARLRLGQCRGHDEAGPPWSSWTYHAPVTADHLASDAKHGLVDSFHARMFQAELFDEVAQYFQPQMGCKVARSRFDSRSSSVQAGNRPAPPFARRTRHGPSSRDLDCRTHKIASRHLVPRRRGFDRVRSSRRTAHTRAAPRVWVRAVE